MAQEVGGNCVIRFIPRKISSSFTGQIGDCLSIEADHEIFLDSAETKILYRVAELFMTEGKNSKSSSNNKDGMEALKRLPTFIQPQQQLQRPQQQSSKPMAVAAPLVMNPRAPTPTTTILSTTIASNSLRPERRRHIVIDNSNLFIGAQSFNKINNRPDPTIRLNASKIAEILRATPAGDCLQIVAGSKPPAQGKIWQHWENAQFRVKVCSRDADTGAEDLVDEFLHAQALNIVLGRQFDPPGENTLVLCTGDGNDNHGFSNFVDVVRNTARAGWRVEIWSWNHSCSQNFRVIAREYPERVTLNFWNNYADQILFK